MNYFASLYLVGTEGHGRNPLSKPIAGQRFLLN